MSTYNQLLYQIVFTTFDCQPVLQKENRPELFKYIWGILKNKKLFDNFQGWQEGYGVFSYSYSAKDTLIEYVKNQEEHHKNITFMEEYKSLLKENGVGFDPKYLK